MSCSTANRSLPTRARPVPIALPEGQQELIVSPGAAFVVDGIQLVGPLGRDCPRRNHSRRDRHWKPRPPRGRRLRVAGIAHPCRPREHQSWLDRTHRRRHDFDPGDRQRLAAGLGGARGHVRHRHADVRLQRRLPRRNHRRPCAAADPRAACVRPRATPTAGVRPGPAVAAHRWLPSGLRSLAAGGVIAGIAGIVVFCAALGVAALLRNRDEWATPSPSARARAG